MNGVRNFRLFNLQGQEVLRQTDLPGTEFELDLSRFTTGTYFFDADGISGKVQRG
jgi:hypothetical protein